MNPIPEISTSSDMEKISPGVKNDQNLFETLLSNIPEHFKAECFMCNTTVFGKRVPYHLFFGQLGCKKCNIIIKTCKIFNDVYYLNKVPCKHSQSGDHQYMWSSQAENYISFINRQELSLERLNNHVPATRDEIFQSFTKYVKTLSILKSHQPWALGFENFKEILKHELSFQKSVKKKENSGFFFMENSSKSNDNNDLQASLLVKTRENCCCKYCRNGNHEECILSTQTKYCALNNSSLSLNEEINKSDSQPLVEVGSLQKSKENQKQGNPSMNNNEEVLLSSRKKEGTQNQDRSLMLSDKDINYQDLDDPNEEVLQSFNIEKFDQAIEYVTVDDSKENEISQRTEVSDTLDEENIPNNKRKASDYDIRGTSKLYRRSLESHTEKHFGFDPPDNIPNEKYLVIHFPTQGCPEECPNCYCEFCPSMLTVNCSTYVSKIVCADCKLTLYVLPD